MTWVAAIGIALVVLGVLAVIVLQFTAQHNGRETQKTSVPAAKDNRAAAFGGALVGSN